MHTKENVKFDIIECKISKPSMSKLIIAHYLARKLFACTTTMPMELNIMLEYLPCLRCTAFVQK